MIELRALNIHWLDGTDPESDLCAHGSVYLKLVDLLVSDDTPDDWTISTTAFYFLRTLQEDHDGESEFQLIPHCGGTMWEIGGSKKLHFVHCDIGINWTISHSNRKIIHRLSDSISFELGFDEWRRAVCAFSDAVMNFYEQSPPKIPHPDEKSGFEHFMVEWRTMRARAFE